MTAAGTQTHNDNPTRLLPARVLIIDTPNWRDREVVQLALAAAARRLRTVKGTGHNVARELVLLLGPAPHEAGAEDTAYRWADRHGVKVEPLPEFWEKVDHPDLDHAADVITACDADLVLAFDRHGSPWITQYVNAASIVCHLPVWHFQHHAGRGITK